MTDLPQDDSISDQAGDVSVPDDDDGGLFRASAGWIASATEPEILDRLDRYRRALRRRQQFPFLSALIPADLDEAIADLRRELARRHGQLEMFSDLRALPDRECVRTGEPEMFDEPAPLPSNISAPLAAAETSVTAPLAAPSPAPTADDEALDDDAWLADAVGCWREATRVDNAAHWRRAEQCARLERRPGTRTGPTLVQRFCD